MEWTFSRLNYLSFAVFDYIEEIEWAIEVCKEFVKPVSATMHVHRR
jgi:hypothetical protein